MNRYERGTTSFDYVRRMYGVPAKRGMRVIANGKPGRITSGNGQYIMVLLDGDKRPTVWHPTWEMVYLTDSPASSLPVREEK